MTLRRLEGEKIPTATRGAVIPYGFGDQLLDVPGIPLQESLAATLANNCGVNDTEVSLKISGPDVALIIARLSPLLPGVLQIGQEWMRYSGFLTNPFRVTISARAYGGTTAAEHDKGSTIYFLESRTIFVFLGMPDGCRYPDDALIQLRINDVAQTPASTVRLQDTRIIPGERFVTVEFDLTRWFGGVAPPPPATTMRQSSPIGYSRGPDSILPPRIDYAQITGSRNRITGYGPIANYNRNATLTGYAPDGRGGANFYPGPPMLPARATNTQSSSVARAVVLRPSLLGSVTADFKGLIDTVGGRYTGTGSAPIVTPTAVTRLILEDTYGQDPNQFYAPAWEATRIAQAARALTWRMLWYGEEFESFRSNAGFCGLADLWIDDDGLWRYTFQNRGAAPVATITQRDLVGEFVIGRIPASATRLATTWGDRGQEGQSGEFTLDSAAMQSRYGVITNRTLTLPYIATESAARQAASYWLSLWDHPRLSGTGNLSHWLMALTRTDRIMIDDELVNIYGHARVPWEIRGTADRGDQRTIIIVESDPIDTISGTCAITLADLILDIDGVLGPVVIGSLVKTLDALALDADGTVTGVGIITGSLVKTLAGIALDADGTTGTTPTAAYFGGWFGYGRWGGAFLSDAGESIMTNAIKWEALFTDRGSVLSTELNALANAARSNAGSAVNNGTNLDQYGKLELTVDFVSSPSAGAYVDVFMVTAPDGTNYEDGSSSVDPGVATRVASIPVRADTAAQRLTSRNFPLPPCPVKFLISNRTGQAFPATGSVLKLYSANDEIQ